jgi:hypothetical protein
MDNAAWSATRLPGTIGLNRCGKIGPHIGDSGHYVLCFVAHRSVRSNSMLSERELGLHLVPI